MNENSLKVGQRVTWVSDGHHANTGIIAEIAAGVLSSEPSARITSTRAEAQNQDAGRWIRLSRLSAE